MTQIAHSKATFSVMGAGSWGTVLAFLLAQNGHNVRLWTRHHDQASIINNEHRNKSYLPDLLLPGALTATTNLKEISKEANAVIWAIPTKASRMLIQHLQEVPVLISCSKGIELESFKTVTEILAEYQPEASLVALSGPNLAQEIALGKPATATVASRNEPLAKNVQAWFHQDNFRVYHSTDIKGIEIAGAMKNVIALAAGLCDGLELGDNAKASLLTRGLAEMIRLGQHVGAKTESFYGLAGLGDMVATCSSPKSRNHQAGSMLARGKKLKDILDAKLTAEGVGTVNAVFTYAQKHQLDLPISDEVYQVVYQNKSPQKAIRDLMRRPLKQE